MEMSASSGFVLFWGFLFVGGVLLCFFVLMFEVPETGIGLSVVPYVLCLFEGLCHTGS